MHGGGMLSALQDELGSTAEPTATAAHLFAHRYARKTETNKDRITYHSAVLLEWSHGLFTTVIELATLNGIGGRRGKSNWCADKLESRPELYRAMPSCMVVPWKGEYAEIRCCDVPAKSLEEFQAYVAGACARPMASRGWLGVRQGTCVRVCVHTPGACVQGAYTCMGNLSAMDAHARGVLVQGSSSLVTSLLGFVGPELRFIDPHFDLSAPVRLNHRGQTDVMRYLINYAGRDRRYTEKVHPPSLALGI